MSATPRFELLGLDHVALAVSDLSRSEAWYRDVLGLERLHQDVWGDYPVFVGSCGTGIALFPVQGDAPLRPPGRDTLAVRHIAFRATRNSFESAQSELTERAIRFEFQDHRIAHSIYFDDPDGHQIEITTYEV